MQKLKLFMNKKITGCKQFFVFIVLLFTCVISCEKQENISPVVNILNPYEHQNFLIPTTIDIDIEVFDDNIIELLKISIVDENIINVSSVEYFINLQIDTINSSITITNLLDEGTYYVRAEAFDGEFTAVSYQEVYLSKEPKKQLGFYSIHLCDNNQIDIYKTDNTQNLFASFLGDYSSSSISSNFQQIGLVGDYMSGIKVFGLENSQIEWSEENNNSTSFPIYEYVGFYNGLLYVCYTNGYVRVFNHLGNIELEFQVEEYYKPIYAYRIYDKLLVFISNIQFEQGKLVTYNLNGFGLFETVFNNKIIKVCKKGNNSTMLFSNNNNQAEIHVFEIDNNNLWEPTILPTGRLFDATRVSENEFLIAHSQELIQYKYSVNSAVNFISNKFFKVFYDEIEDEVISSKSNELIVYDYSTKNVKKNFYFSDSIAAIHVAYSLD